jgi:hypothetical protein
MTTLQEYFQKKNKKRIQERKEADLLEFQQIERRIRLERLIREAKAGRQ